MSAHVFEWTCELLEARTTLNRLEARGTVRLALKSAGFDPKRVSGVEMAAVLEKVMPGELETRGIADAESICMLLAVEASGLRTEGGDADSPETIFARLGR